MSDSCIRKSSQAPQRAWDPGLVGRYAIRRLAIIELKASEHIHLPLQAADDWLRVRKHLERGEISRYGYFPGVELQQTPPLVYLVAPGLRFPSIYG